ncbi:MAG: thioredoxin-dependent thiol peroxidase [Emcibacteraceae bacterium]|nr:thioredoxin-dependent thiol peroxidase [Emcibacteraceae bacterium]MDG1996375.1 thioredoxin-dependent thiol peroxidase [Emcibacteraceae bacterium]
MLKIGQKAPDFNLPDETGENVSLSNFEGKNIILFFYPKDDTPGCTIESIAFSHLKKEFEALNTVILGASKDSVKKHQKFIQKHDLTVKLLVDAEGTLCEDYTIWVLKKLYGREYMGIERATFLIGTDGLIKQIWRKVKAKGHAEEVLEVVKAL